MIVRVILLLALLGSAAVVFYGLCWTGPARPSPLTVAGLFVLGVTSAVISVGLAMGAISAGQDGRGLRAMPGRSWAACSLLGAAGALAGAVVFGCSPSSRGPYESRGVGLRSARTAPGGTLAGPRAPIV